MTLLPDAQCGRTKAEVMRDLSRVSRHLVRLHTINAKIGWRIDKVVQERVSLLNELRTHYQ